MRGSAALRAVLLALCLAPVLAPPPPPSPPPPPPPPLDGLRRWSLHFDGAALHALGNVRIERASSVNRDTTPEHVEPVSAGVDDSLLMPSISGIRGVSLWVWLDTRAEANYVVYFLDARSGDPNGQFSNTCAPQPTPKPLIASRASL